MPALDFETTMSADEQPLTYSLYRVASETVQEKHNSAIIEIYHVSTYYVLRVQNISIM